MKFRTLAFLKFVLNALEENWIVAATLTAIIAKLAYINVVIGLYDWSETHGKMMLVSAFLFSGLLVSWTLVLKKRARFIANVVIDASLSLLFVADMVYLRFFKSLPSVSSIFYIDQASGVQDSIAKLFKPQDIFFFLDILAFIAAVIIGKKFLKEKNGKLSPRQNCNLGLVVSTVILATLGLVLKIDNTNFAMLYRRSYDSMMIVERYNVLGYHAMDVSRFLSSSFKKITEEESDKVLGWLKENKTKPGEDNAMTGAAKGKNVIVLQVESLQNAVIGQRLEGQEITPNLNKLVGSSYYFDNYYYQMGLGGTSDTDFSINTSFYPLNDSSAFVRYAKGDYSSLPKEMEKVGYSANAYHGFARSFWNRNVAYKSLGYEKFLGSESYPTEPKIGMGVGDKEFLLKTAEYISEETKKGPSLSYAVTLSSHFPFTDPESYAEIKLTRANYTAEAYNYLTAINYTDGAIGQFIEALKQKGLYDNSVIVIYGDHYANIGDTAAASTQAAFGISNGNTKADYLKLKKVPLIIHLPNQEKAEKISDPASHMDVMPTVLNLVGAKSTAPMFGRDLFGNAAPYFGSVLYLFDGLAMDRDHTYVYGKIQGLENGECYLSANWQKTDVNECADLEKRRSSEIKYVNEIVTYNLLKNFQPEIAQGK